MTNVVIASAARTPVGSFNGAFATTAAHDLGSVAIKAALERAGVEAAQWAGQGMTSAEHGLEGPLGFGATHHGADQTVAFAWRMAAVSHK
ncbi:MAG: acetyl-CoA C-acetyltransferase, partial [Pseudomonadota bacterium]